MREPYPYAVSVPSAHGTHGIRTPAGETLFLDQMAKLEKDCTVAVFLNGQFVLVGRILRRPTPYRRLVIGCRDVRGTEGITRIWGLRDRDVQVWRVVGVYLPTVWSDEPDDDSADA